MPQSVCCSSRIIFDLAPQKRKKTNQMLNGLPTAMQLWFVLGISHGTSEKWNYLRLKKCSWEKINIYTLYIYLIKINSSWIFLWKFLFFSRPLAENLFNKSLQKYTKILYEFPFRSLFSYRDLNVWKYVQKICNNSNWIEFSFRSFLSYQDFQPQNFVQYFCA